MANKSVSTMGFSWLASLGRSAEVVYYKPHLTISCNLCALALVEMKNKPLGHAFIVVKLYFFERFGICLRVGYVMRVNKIALPQTGLPTRRAVCQLVLQEGVNI